MPAADLHSAVEAGLNAGDLDALVALYEPDAQLLGEDGAAAVGHDAIREAYTGLVAFGGRLSVTTRYAVEQGDIALLSNQWTFELGRCGGRVGRHLRGRPSTARRQLALRDRQPLQRAGMTRSA
jgi:ketosteroid isomerase-like protein